MRSFKDTEGIEWQVKVNVATLKRVELLTEHVLTDLLDPKSETAKLAAKSQTFLPDLLYAVVKPQADERGISDIRFGEGLSGDALGNAAEALLREIVDFFHDPRRRQMMGQMLDKGDQVMTIILEQEQMDIAAADPAEIAKKAIEEAKSRASGLSSSVTDTPVSSA